MNRFLSLRNKLTSLALIVGVAPLATACGLDGVVGGNCKAGYTEVAGQCVVSPSSTGSVLDPNKDRASTTTPISSANGSNDATPTTGPSEEPTTSTGTVTPPTGSSNPSSNPSSPTSPVGIVTQPVGGFNPNANDFPPAPQPPVVVVAPPVNPTPVVGLVCEPPLVACHGVCISVQDDPRNCGACGRICASNICIAGVCQGATPGDVVLIGHDMKAAWNGSVQAKVLSNAVSIPTADPIRVLSYEIGADADGAAWSRTLIQSGVPRQVQITTATNEALDSASLYANYDVVLMQGDGSDPAGLGGRWASPLQTFTKKGGVFIALDTAATNIPALVNATGMLNVSGHFALPGTTHFDVTGAYDVVGQKLLSPYASFGPSVGFTGVDAPNADLTWVVRVQGDHTIPTVVHKVAR